MEVLGYLDFSHAIFWWFLYIQYHNEDGIQSDDLFLGNLF